MSKEDETWALVICSNGKNKDGSEAVKWEHVSARIGYKKYHGKLGERTPTWDEMCIIKSLFWEDEEVVIQIHPKSSDYVNMHPHVLHLWKPTDVEIPTPPISLV